MKHPILESIEIRIEELSEQYYKNKTEENYKKWQDMMGEYARASKEVNGS